MPTRLAWAHFYIVPLPNISIYYHSYCEPIPTERSLALTRTRISIYYTLLTCTVPCTAPIQCLSLLLLSKCLFNWTNPLPRTCYLSFLFPSSIAVDWSASIGYWSSEYYLNLEWGGQWACGCWRTGAQWRFGTGWGEWEWGWRTSVGSSSANSRGAKYSSYYNNIIALLPIY